MNQCVQRIFDNRVLLIVTVALVLITGVTIAGISRAETGVTASLSTTQFSMNKAAILIINVTGARSADINMPKIENLRFHPRGESTQVQIINGSFSASVSSKFLIQALEPGKYTIPPIAVQAGGDKLLTQPLSFEVTQGTRSNTTPSSPGKTSERTGSEKDSEVAFLQIMQMKERSYIGEVVPIEIKAYFRQGIKVKLTALPALQGDGFVMPPLREEVQQTVEQVNNINYSVITWQSSLTAIKEGKHPLALELEATLLFPQRSRRSSLFNNRGFFQDDLFDDFFGSYQSKTVRLATPITPIEALPLPLSNKPVDFTGAIGDFTLDVQATPTDIEVGDPITLTMTIHGAGNFDRVSAPLFPTKKDWKTYSPSPEFFKEGSINKGKKRFEQAIVLKNPKLTAIPSLSFVYFDPNAKKYIRRTTSPIPIKVTNSIIAPVPVSNTAQAPSHSQSTGETLPSTKGIEGLAPIQLETSRHYQELRPLFFQHWFQVLVALCAFLLLFVLFINLRRRHLDNHPELTRKKQREQLFARNIEFLAKQKCTERSPQFLAGCRKVIQEQLGLLWGVEASAITFDDLQQKLSPTSSLLTIFAAAERSAYGGLTLSEEEILEYFEKLHKELGAIE